MRRRIRVALLVLGAQVKPDGTPSDMLEDRIATAEALYRAGFDTWDSAQRARRAGLRVTGFAAHRRASGAVARPQAATEGTSWGGCRCARRSRA